MKNGSKSACGGICRVAALMFYVCAAAAAADPLEWNSERQEVRADLENWPLSRVLESIGSMTGWQIYVEPETRSIVSTRFQSLKPDEALRRLLGDLNYAVLQQTNGPARLFVYRNSLQDATLLIEAPPKARKKDHRIPNELVVTLKPGSKETIDELAKRLGAKVIGRIDDLHAYRLQFDSADAAQQARSQLASDQDVNAVDNNFAIDRPSGLEPLAMSSVPALNLNPNASPNSRQLVVALIDTPVYGQGSPAKDFLLPGISLAGETSATPTELTHGTAMAETILESIAAYLQGSGNKDPRILPVDIYGNDPNTTTFDIARGIERALEKNPSIFNLSLGGESDSPFLHQVISELQKRGFVFVAAAGNTPTTDPFYPAAWQEVLSVAAGTSRGGLAPYSNHSDSVDMIAPGTSVVHFGDQAYLATGTSTAAAYASGAIAAYLLAHPDATAAQAESEIQKRSPVPAPARP